MANDSLPPPIGGTSDVKQSPSKARKATPISEPIKLTLVALGLALILMALLPTALHPDPLALLPYINIEAAILAGAGIVLLTLSALLLRVRRHWAHFLMLCASLCLMAVCAAWLVLYYSMIPIVAGHYFILIPIFLICVAAALIASAVCLVSALVVLFVKTDSTGALQERLPQRVALVGGSLVGAVLVFLFLTVSPRVSPDFLIHEIDADTVTITGCQKEASGKLVIPQAIEGKPVTRIGERAFTNCTELTSIIIPDGVTSIGTKAFEKCYSLREVTIPAGVTSIGAGAFYYCHDLATITIPDGVTSIEEKTYSMCLKLTSVTFLGDVPKVAENAFQHSPSVINGLSLTIYRRPEAKGWGETFAGRPVKLISEKP